MTTKPTTPALILDAGSIKLDRLARRVTVNGAEVRLTPAAFTLLEALLLTPGKVLTVRELRVPDHSVPFYISMLRQRLGAAGKLIRTVYGKGYVIEKDTK